MMSEQIDELAAALSKAQAQFKPAKKTRTNPHFRNSYADLADLQEATREALSKNNLCVFQMLSDDHHCLITMLAHSSGQWVQTSLPLLTQKEDMQGLGSAITYASRYGYSAITGVASEEDDDGTAAVKNAAPAAPAGPKKVTEKQIGFYQSKYRAVMLKEDVETALKKFNVTKPEDLLMNQFDPFLTECARLIDAKKQLPKPS